MSEPHELPPELYDYSNIALQFLLTGECEINGVRYVNANHKETEALLGASLLEELKALAQHSEQVND